MLVRNRWQSLSYNVHRHNQTYHAYMRASCHRMATTTCVGSYECFMEHLPHVGYSFAGFHVRFRRSIRGIEHCRIHRCVAFVYPWRNFRESRQRSYNIRRELNGLLMEPFARSMLPRNIVKCAYKCSQENLISILNSVLLFNFKMLKIYSICIYN